MNANVKLYIDLVDENTLLCEKYFMDSHGKEWVFFNIKANQTLVNFLTFGGIQ